MSYYILDDSRGTGRASRVVRVRRGQTELFPRPRRLGCGARSRAARKLRRRGMPARAGFTE